MNGSRVRVPDGMSRPFQVFVNGVEQAEGTDFTVTGEWIVFSRALIPPKREDAKSVFRGFFWGRYKPEHVVDVACQVGGRAHVFSQLPIEPGDASDESVHSGGETAFSPERDHGPAAD